jgi:hypothetical protein
MTGVTRITLGIVLVAWAAVTAGATPAMAEDEVKLFFAVEGMR